jgi:hypothetical protein
MRIRGGKNRKGGGKNEHFVYTVQKTVLLPKARIFRSLEAEREVLSGEV